MHQEVDARLSDVAAATEEILRAIQADPAHVRPWLRGIEAEAERVLIDVDATRRRASRRFVTWLCLGLEESGALRVPPPKPTR